LVVAERFVVVVVVVVLRHRTVSDPADDARVWSARGRRGAPNAAADLSGAAAATAADV